jgi:hypothetical protein
MEINQLLDNSGDNELKINELIKGYLTTTYKWTKFFAVLSFVIIGIMVIVGISMFFMANYLSDLPFGAGFGSLLGTFYLIIAVIYIPIAVYLNNFSGNMKNAINYTNNEALETAFQNLKSYYKYTGIFTVVFLILYILFIIGMIVAAIMGFSAF